ncbi:MAG TPA: DUF2867 domain-containing protein [Bacteroidetes bacterium]|nr:DUF2867 domain-containing protein [Bacteroidota bacterium]
MKIYQLPLPQNSIIEKALPRIDYFDVYAMETGRPVPVEQLPKLFFESFPTWFMALMGLRETVAGWIGLKTAKGMDLRSQFKNFKGEVGDSIAIFNVMGRSEQEIMTGENDKHLDFRLSYFSRPKGTKTEILMATTVQFNNWLGRAYFFPVKPIHRLVMPIILRRMERRRKGGLSN